MLTYLLPKHLSGWCLMVLMLALPFTTPAQISVSSNLEPSTIEIGTPATLTTVITHSGQATISDINYSVLDGIADLEVLNSERFQKEASGDKQQTILEITLTCWEQGRYEIPAIPVTYQIGGTNETAIGQAFTLQVTSPPVEQDSLRLMPIKDVVEEPLNFRDVLPYLIILVVLIAVAAFVYYLYRRQQAPPPPPPPVLLPAHKYALSKLEKLEKEKLWQQGNIKAYHSELTRVLREYLEHRYRINALEITSEEIIRGLKQKGMPEEKRTTLGQLLRTVDLVKFAKAEPPASFHKEAGENVVSFINDTEDETIKIELAREEVPESLRAEVEIQYPEKNP